MKRRQLLRLVLCGAVLGIPRRSVTAQNDGRAPGDETPTAAVRYTTVESNQWREVWPTLADSQRDIAEMLNRVERTRINSIPVIVVPERWFDAPLSYSPYPLQYDAPSSFGDKILVVDQASQSFAAFERGAQVRWGPISSGRETMPTPAGLLHLNWRSRGRHSTVDPTWFMPWYFNFHNTRGLSFHQYVLPGHPASHACIRLLERDARWLFDWGEEWVLDDSQQRVLEQGTPVLILSCYDFNAPPPWRSLDWLRRGVHIPAQPDASQRSC